MSTMRTRYHTCCFDYDCIQNKLLSYYYIYHTCFLINLFKISSRIKMNCGCGRSPTGKRIGWHGLSEEQYQEALKKWEEENKDK